MSSSDALTESVQQLLRRYRDRLIARTSLLSLLSLAALSALMWRLWLAKTPPVGLLGIGLVGLLILARWQWFMWRRERLSTNTVALDVDRTLNLHARLITATELAREPHPPALYPRLLQETREALASASAKLPRVVDRRVAWLSAALLLLLLWRSHPAASLTQLAKHTLPQPPPQPEQPPPPPPEQQDAPAQSSRDQQQQQQSNQGQGADQSQPSQSSGSQQPQQPSQRGTEQGEESDEGQRAKASPQQGEAGKDHTADRRKESANSSEEHTSDQKQIASQSTQDHRQDGRQDQRAGRTGTSSTSERDGKAERQQSAKEAAQGAQQMSEGQDALKGEIQQLLKQLSEELQSLQAHVAEQRLDRPHPAPGTSTDPQLYDDADVSPQADASKRRLPIQMTVDRQMAASRRAAGGVGEPSDDVAAQTPQELEEEAQLSTQAADAEAVTRPAIPPEYQPVFDRLSSQPQEPPSQ